MEGNMITFFLFLAFIFISFIGEASQAFSVSIEPKSWHYKGSHIGYEVVKNQKQQQQQQQQHVDDNDTMDNDRSSTKEYPILLLNGFGVGSFHQHRLMPNLIHVQKQKQKDSQSLHDDNVVEDMMTTSETATRTIYGIDYLGQGRSWPIDCNDGNSINEKGLIYSIDTWVDQVIEFIETVIIPSEEDDVQKQQQEQQKPSSSSNEFHTTTKSTIKVHLIGNSVGGHLSAILAAKRPDLVESICLLNATPVWGLNLPGWDGVLPPPFLPRIIGRYFFDQIRNLKTIETYLDNAYYYRDAFDEELMGQIRGCTEGKGGHAAFASIMWSPPNGYDKDFYNILKQVECDVLLLFGKNDPWCTPAFAKRMFQSLQERNEHNNNNHINEDATTQPKQQQQSSPSTHIHRYVELENVGHCPNHEAPNAVGSITSLWTSNRQRDRETLDLLVDSPIRSTKNENDSSNSSGGSSSFEYNEAWGNVTAREIASDEVHLSLMERIITSLV